LNDITPQQRTNPEVDWHAKEILNRTEEKLLELTQQKNEVSRKIEALRRTANALIDMFGEHLISPDFLRVLGRKTPTHARGFTDACRQVLLKADRPLRVSEICERLGQEYPDILQRHKDPVSSVGTILNRLVSYGEAKIAVVNGRKAWNSVGDKPGPNSPTDPAQNNVYDEVMK
jgi:hypothetical protein